MLERKTIGSGTYWEDIVGYSRAIRVGNIVEVAGTTAMDNNQVVGLNDAYAQTKFILTKIDKILTKAGCSMQDVVRTRMFVTNIDDWEAIGKAHGEFFRDIKPVATMVEVSRLIKEELLVEIEVSAVIH